MRRRRRSRGVADNIGAEFPAISAVAELCNRVTNHGDMSTFSKPESITIHKDPNTVQKESKLIDLTIIIKN